MDRTLSRKTARVNRRHARLRLAEWLSGLGLAALMAGLFLNVQGPRLPEPEPTLAARFLDLREEAPARTVQERTGQITAATSLEDVLQVLGAAPGDATDAIGALKARGLIGRARLAPGTEVSAFFQATAEPEETWPLASVSILTKDSLQLVASRHSDGSFTAAKLNAEVFIRPRFVSGTLTTTLAAAIRFQGGTPDQAAPFAGTLPPPGEGRLPQAGDRYELVFDAREDEHGRYLGMERLRYAGFSGLYGGDAWYRFTPADTGRDDFFRTNGFSRGAMLNRFPIGRVPINSRFGPRVHPISSQPHLHRGVDFAAPEGSEVVAAGDGEIAFMGWSDGYGQVVRIRHERGYETVYAHMKAFRPGVKAGQRVNRGDIIGYVGSTGSATGPHLHYEIRRNGMFLDPMMPSIPSGRDLTDEPVTMDAFRAAMFDVDSIRGKVGQAQFASGTGPALPSRGP
ncbi:MAG: M23 family metallopeptidase [Hyphomonas sp.]|nr:M23 family metallopeptidase [Hyphomonas sp.]